MAKKNAIITGAAGGIGKAIVQKFAREGINIWACEICKSDEFETNLKLIAEKYQVWLKPVYFNLDDEDDVKNGIQSIIKEKEPIDILVNNAGVSPVGLLSMTKMEDIRKTMEINYFAQLQIIQLVSKVMMRQKSGSIINMGSVSGCEYAEKGGLSYGGSKAALIFATKILAREFASFNIRVNAVSPGLVDTAMWQNREENLRNEAIEHSVMKRLGDPEEIANVVYFLSSDSASYMSGANVIVEGGGRIAF